MAFEIDLNPVDHLTMGYVGTPGNRVFYIQAFQAAQVVTLLCEKQQVQSLAISAERFIKSLQQRNPQLLPATDIYEEDDMALKEPLNPLFRVGEIGLGYDEGNDLLMLVISEIVMETEEGSDPPPPPALVRLWVSRSQMLAACRYGTSVVKQGRPALFERRNGHHK